jgi:hypothetical protein
MKSIIAHKGIKYLINKEIMKKALLITILASIAMASCKKDCIHPKKPNTITDTTVIAK